ncbi:MAG TPA: AAA family ATPase [Nostocaceae cyanobacterium]|nr:AAA family ATPase [Nostocaceae cyanobacterium]
MIISHIILKNWRNFRSVDVDLRDRVFVVGPNACGKSNFLDVFRFLRDIAKPGGGLQTAVKDRGGVSKIRCLSARQNPKIEIEVHISDYSSNEPVWKYAIGITQQTRGHRQPILAYERVWKGNENIVNRPDEDDKKDELRLTQTHLEQISANANFREIAKFFESVLYLHLVPQLLRYPEAFSGPGISEDPFGRSFLERIVKTPEKTRKSRLTKIENALRSAVPQLKHLTDIKDEMGIPHLEAVYEHWRPQAGKQREDQFSDGTLRLIGLLWSLLERDSLLLLEEPELSLNAAIVKKLPTLMYRMQREKKRQIILTTHSADLLEDPGIGGEELLLLTPSSEGTQVTIASSIDNVRDLLEGGLSVAEAVLPLTKPSEINQLEIRL